MTGPATPESTPTPPAQPAPAATGVPGVASADSSGTRKREELLDSMRAVPSRLVVVTGTGVTLQSIGAPGAGTEVAGWPGLLADGLARCRKLNLIDDEDAEIVAHLITAKKCEWFIHAAEKIHECLAKRVNERETWMKDSVGSLKVKDQRLIKAIVALHGLISTLNYDSTIQQVTGLPALHWLQQRDITRRLRTHATDFTLHWHGVSDDMGSIVLDRTSYQEISTDTKMQGLRIRESPQRCGASRRAMNAKRSAMRNGIPMATKQATVETEFATVQLVLDSGADTPAVDAFALSLIKHERQSYVREQPGSLMVALPLSLPLAPLLETENPLTFKG